MIFDSAIILICKYGVFPLMIVMLVKFLVLLRFKPLNPSFAFRNLFTYFSKYGYFRIKDKDKAKWLKIKHNNNQLAVVFYLLLGLWILATSIIFIFSNK